MAAFKKYGWILIIACAVLIGYLLLKQYQTDLNNELNAEVRQAEALGVAYGLDHDQKGCLTQALINIKGCSAFRCGVVHGRFFKACLAEAQPNKAFCDGVPGYTEKQDRDTKDWLRDICFEHPESNICSQLMRQRQQLCGS
ncbi:MAG: hypothetical protein QF872_04305 [Gammaproteobacteria bacterium]|nr:hypothetical protein [Gammaproteobacteria bacterium]